MIRLYLAGPMTGLPALNFPAFHLAAARLRENGYEVVSPAELVPDQARSWEDCMRLAIAGLLTCEQIALLPGWEKSRGATIEAGLAHELRMHRILLPALETQP